MNIKDFKIYIIIIYLLKDTIIYFVKSQCVLLKTISSFISTCGLNIPGPEGSSCSGVGCASNECETYLHCHTFTDSTLIQCEC